MSDRDGLTRRDLLRLSGAGTLLGMAGRTPAAAQTLRRTPSQILGPFYPLVKPLDQDADLTAIAGGAGRAAGQIVEVSGRIINREGKPVAGARVEIWQANTHGRYTHPSDRNPAPLDPNFEGFAVLSTDIEGRYRFKTIKPGAYPEESGVMRAPHIHFEVVGRTNRLITQMYFAGEALNDTDRFLATASGNKEGLIVPFQRSADGVLVGAWDVVLDRG